MSTLTLGSCRLAAPAQQPRKLASLGTCHLRPVRGLNSCRALASRASRSRARDLPTAACAALAVADQLVAAGCPSSDVAALQRADDAWRALCEKGPPAARQVVFRHSGTAQQVSGTDAFDVVVLGGTLGILLATALLANNSSSGGRPLRVAVVERGQLLGRDQEWNITRSELQVFQDLGVLTAEEVETAVTTTYPGVRLGVARGPAYSVGGVMDCGVSPHRLLEAVTRRFKALGGTLLEHTAFTQADVYDNASLLTLQHTPRTSPAPAAAGAGGTGAAFAPVSGTAGQQQQEGQVMLSAQLVLDALGGFSPISMQMRAGQRPESAMLLVGGCTKAAPGDPAGDTADVLWARTGLDSTTGMQYWWEKFPAQGGAATTTYMFTFTDPAPSHVGLLSTMAGQYLQQLPQYLAEPTSSTAGAGADKEAGQGSVPPLERLLVGFVPCYDGSVAPAADRVLPVGDSAANRSTLSLAGFCALVRHLPRLVGGIREALDAGALTAQELALLQPYCPGVATTSSMQRTMAVHSNQTPGILASLAHSQPGSTASSTTAAAGAGTKAVDQDVVVDMVGGSFKAMWEAVGGEAGMQPFLADCITWGHMSATIGRQLQLEAPKVLAYHLFLGDSRSGPRLLSGLAGLAAYTALHAASAWTGPFHEALLAHQPRLLFRWRRAVEAWRYGSGADWAPAPAPAAAVAGGGVGGRQLEQQRPATPGGGGRLTESADEQQQQQGGLSQTGVHHAVPLATAGPPRGPIVALGIVDPDSPAAAAAAAEGGEEQEATAGLKAVVDADWLWDVTHSVDTHEDAMAEGWEAPGPAAAAALQSEDTYEDALLMKGLRLDTTTKSSSSSSSHEAAVAGAVEQFTALGASAAAAAAGRAPQPRGGPAEWSVDTYEESLLEYSSSSSSSGDVTARGPAGPQQGDSAEWFATHSQDNNEDSLMDGWDTAAAVTSAAGGGDAGDPSKWSLDTYEDSMLKGVAAAAVSEAEWDATHSQDNNEEDLLGAGSKWSNPAAAAVITVAAAHLPGAESGDAVVIGGVSVSPVYHSQDTYEEDLLAAAGVDVVVAPPAAAPGADSATAAPKTSSSSGKGAVGGSAAGLGPRGGPVVGFLVVKEAQSAEKADKGAQEAEGSVYQGPVAEGGGNTPAGGGGSSSAGSQGPPKRSAGNNNSSTSSSTSRQGSSSSGQQRGAGEGAQAPKPGSWRGTWRPQPGGGKGSRRLSNLEQGPDEGV